MKSDDGRWGCECGLLQVGLGQLFFQGGRGVEVNHEVRVLFVRICIDLSLFVTNNCYIKNTLYLNTNLYLYL